MLARYVLLSCDRRSVCPSIRLSQVRVLRMRLNLESRRQRHTIAQELAFAVAKDLGEIPTVLPPTGAPYRDGVRYDTVD